jgi:hypothetical protein
MGTVSRLILRVSRLEPHKAALSRLLKRLIHLRRGYGGQVVDESRAREGRFWQGYLRRWQALASLGKPWQGYFAFSNSLFFSRIGAVIRAAYPVCEPREAVYRAFFRNVAISYA